MLIGSYLGFESYFHYVPMSYFGWQGPRLSKATSWLTWVSHLCSWHWSEGLKASLIKYLGYLKYLKIDSNCLWYYSICISVKKCTCGHQSLSSGLLKLKIKNGIEIIGVKEKKRKEKKRKEGSRSNEKNTWAHHVNCLWSEGIDHVWWFMHESCAKKSEFPDVRFISRRNLFVLNTRVWSVILWFLKIFPCPYLGFSQFVHPPVFQEQIFLDVALVGK